MAHCRYTYINNKLLSLFFYRVMKVASIVEKNSIPRVRVMQMSLQCFLPSPPDKTK